ncbi:MAG: enoyl-CoA hydratase/isomerase family protein [Nitrospirae bacterium]|nr:enoyl-CoA hydratase/isomerase family protein [Nitrospirota bacterium]
MSELDTAQISEDLVNLEVEEIENGKKVATIIFNDHDRRNAMTEDMAVRFRVVVEELRSIKPDVIIVTGAGSAFSAGGDLQMIEKKQSQPYEQNRDEMFEFYNSFLAVLDLDVPVIAAVNGAAIGAGLCFASVADVRLVAEGEKKNLGFSFSKLGLTPGMGGTVFVPLRIGEEKAQLMFETGDNITPIEACEAGMFDEVVKLEELRERTREIAIRIAFFSEEAEEILSKRIDKQVLRDGLVKESEGQGASFLTEEHRSKYRTFVEGLSRK